MNGARLHGWRWLEAALIPLISAAMRMAWVSPLLQLALNNPVVQPGGMVVPPWWLLALLLGPVLLQRLPLKRPWMVALLAGAGLASIPITWALAMPGSQHGFSWLATETSALLSWQTGIPGSFVLALAATLLWQRGIASRALQYEDLWRSFVWGSLAMGAMMLLPAETLSAIPGVQMVASLATFVLAGLFGLAMSSLGGTLVTENARSNAPVGMSAPWLGVLATLTLGILALGWAVAWALAPGTFTILLTYLKPLADLVLWLLTGLGALLAYALLWLIRPIMQTAYDRIMSILRRDDLGSLRHYLLEELGIGEREPPQMGRALELAWRPLLMVGLVAAAIWLFRRAMRKSSAVQQTGMIETRESILSAGLVRSQITELLQREHRRPVFLPLTEGSPRDAIRAIYQAMLEQARAAGAPHRKSQTPAQYAQSLLALWPGQAQALELLTHLYVRARYAQEEPGETDVEAARNALAELRIPQKAAVNESHPGRARSLQQ